MSTNGANPARNALRILIVTPLDGIDTAAEPLGNRLGAKVERAATHSAALRMLERKSYSAVVLDQIIADSDPEGADVLWKHSGLAVPLQVNLAIAGTERVERELRAALARRQREQQLAEEAASAALDAELKNAVTAFLLEAQLALREDGVPPGVQNRLRTIESIAERIRARLHGSIPSSHNGGIEPGNFAR